MLEEVIMKDNENIKRSLMYVDDMSDNMMEHVVH